MSLMDQGYELLYFIVNIIISLFNIFICGAY